MFRLTQYAFRISHQAIKRPIFSSKTFTRTYLSDAYQAFDKWDESLSTEILQKTNISMYKKTNISQQYINRNFFSSIPGELLIDVEDKLNRKKYVSSLDIEIVSQMKSIIEYPYMYIYCLACSKINSC